jgi:hypothetical protein
MRGPHVLDASIVLILQAVPSKRPAAFTDYATSERMYLLQTLFIFSFIYGAGVEPSPLLLLSFIGRIYQSWKIMAMTVEQLVG